MQRVLDIQEKVRPERQRALCGPEVSSFRPLMLCSRMACLFIFFAIGGGSVRAQAALHNTAITPRLTVGIPAAFSPLAPGQLTERFGSARDYLGAYATPAHDASLVITQSYAQWSAGDEAIMKDFLRSNILALYGTVGFLSMEVRPIPRDKAVVFAEFEGAAGPEEPILTPYVYMAALVEGKNAIILRFICLREHKERWQPVAQSVMESLFFE